MAQSYPKQDIGSELSTVPTTTQTKIDQIVALFAQLVISAHT
jgi:hypothetical protein